MTTKTGVKSPTEDDTSVKNAPVGQPLVFGHACATRPLEWPANAHLVLAMRRPRWRTRPVLEAGGVSIPAAGPSDALLNAYLGKVPRTARNSALSTLEVPKLTWDECA